MNEPATEQWKALAHQDGLRLVVLFGSQVSRTADSASDTDIGFLPKVRLDWRRRCELHDRLAELPGLSLDQIDLVSLWNASPMLAHQVAEHGRPLFESEPGEWQNFRQTAAALW